MVWDLSRVASHTTASTRGETIAKRMRWEDLSPKYRQRLERHGITKAQHEAGISLGKARGKPPAPHPPGAKPVGEKTYAQLKKDANALNWNEQGSPPRSGTDMVNQALAQGLSPDWIRRRLRDRKAWTAAYNGPRNPGPGHTAWLRRGKYVDPWYWYH